MTGRTKHGLGVAAFVLSVAMSQACASLLGITDGTPLDDDGGVDAGLDGAQPDGSTVVTDAESDADAADAANVDACVPRAKRELCKNHCGPIVNCGVTELCPNDCDGGPCTLNCGCVAESDNVACTRAGATCGAVLNNCNVLVKCGTGCLVGQECRGNMCCRTPASVCNGACETTVASACGPIACSCASASEVCAPRPDGTKACCMPDPSACTGKQCGSAPNGCGGTVACLDICRLGTSCGTFTDPNACCLSGSTCASFKDCCSTETCHAGALVGDKGMCHAGSCSPSFSPCADSTECCVGYSCLKNVCQ